MRKGTCSGNEVSATTALSAPQHGPQHYWLLFLNSISQAWHVSFAYRCRTEASPSSHSLLSSAYGWKQAFSLPPRTKEETNSSLYIYSTYCWVGPRFPRCPPSAKRCCPHSSVPERTTRRQPGGDTPRLPFRSHPGAAPHAGAPLFPPLRQLPALTALSADPSRDSSAPASHPRERPQLSAVAAVPPGPKGGSHAAQPPPACHDTDRCNSPAGPAAWHSPGLFLSPPPPVRRPQPSEPRGRRASRLLTKTRHPPPPPRTETTRPSLPAASPSASRSRRATATPSCVARPALPSPHLLGDELVLLAGHHGRWRGAGPAAGRAERRRRRQQQEAERRRRLILLRRHPSRRRLPPPPPAPINEKTTDVRALARVGKPGLSPQRPGRVAAVVWACRRGSPPRWVAVSRGCVHAVSYWVRCSPCGSAQPPRETEGQSPPRAPPALGDLAVISVRWGENGKYRVWGSRRLSFLSSARFGGGCLLPFPVFQRTRESSKGLSRAGRTGSCALRGFTPCGRGSVTAARGSSRPSWGRGRDHWAGASGAARALSLAVVMGAGQAGRGCAGCALPFSQDCRFILLFLVYFWGSLPVQCANWKRSQLGLFPEMQCAFSGEFTLWIPEACSLRCRVCKLRDSIPFSNGVFLWHQLIVALRYQFFRLRHSENQILIHRITEMHIARNIIVQSAWLWKTL